jgi:hypothetical protein
MMHWYLEYMLGAILGPALIGMSLYSIRGTRKQPPVDWDAELAHLTKDN